MAIEMQEVVRNALKNATQSAGGTVVSARASVDSNGGLSGMKGSVAGAGAARPASVAIKAAARLASEVGGDGLKTVYNQWTQFEEWPKPTHRVTRVTQEDDCTVSCAVRIWGKKNELSANIQTQRANERIKWQVSQGMEHTGEVVQEHDPRFTKQRDYVGHCTQP